MYTYSLDRTWEQFVDCLTGNKTAPVLVVSKNSLDKTALTALQKSCDSFDYPTYPLITATLQSASPQQLITLVEGIDPFRLIFADEASTSLAEEAYHRKIPFYELTSLLARPTIAFLDFEAMLNKEASKQQAWKLLKQLLKTND